MVDNVVESGKGRDVRIGTLSPKVALEATYLFVCFLISGLVLCSVFGPN